MANAMPTRRVAMILPGLGRVRRGAETAFLELATRLSGQHGLDVELFGSGDDVPEGLPIRRVACVPRERFERWPRVPCLRTEYHYEELSFVLGLAASRAFRPERFDAVVSCTYPFVNWFLRLGAGRARPRLVFATQNGDWMCRAASREYRYFGCDGLVCINPEHFERHRGRYRAAMIPNGVDAERFRPASTGDAPFDDPRWPRDRPVVLVVGALIASKGVDAAIEAVARRSDPFLVVAGDGPHRRALAEHAARVLPNRHLFLGSVDRAEMPALFRRADAFLHVSREEPFGIVYLEAAASGLPIVAPDVAVPRWILGPAAEYFAAAESVPDPEAIAAALDRALDPDAGAALGRDARARVLDGWTWDVQAARYRDFLDELLTDAPTR